MELNISDRILKADYILSNMNPMQRIIFVQSDDRQLIGRLVQESTALRARLSSLAQNAGLNLSNAYTLDSMITSGYALRFSDRYLDRNPFGKLLNRTSYLAQIPDPAQQEQMNKRLRKDEEILLFYVTDFELVDNNLAARMIKAFLDSTEKSFTNALLLIGSSDKNMPASMMGQICLLQLGSPSQQEIRIRIENEIKDERARRAAANVPSSEVAPELLDKYAREMTGLTTAQLENVYALLRDRFCTAMDSRLRDIIWQQKRLEGEKDSNLEFIEVPENPRIVGVGRFNQWLNQRVEDLTDPEAAKVKGTPPPKGVLLFGVPGTGKSQLAKLMAYRWSEWGNCPVSLLKFNIGTISSRYVGESEKQMDRYLSRIGANAPGILFIDEIEKVFHRDMHEVKQAQMSYLLSWSAQDHGNIVSFYTANSVEDIPPELIRDGRISARFFVFLPTAYDLTEIIYTKLFPKRKQFEKEFGNDILEICRVMDEAAGGRCSSEDLRSALKETALFQVLVNLGDWAKSNNRSPFMTGANVETLLELTFRCLRKKGVLLNKCDADTFRDTMTECCCTTTFNPEGQSNLGNIVKIYLQGKQFEYEDIADPSRTLLPFHCFNEDGLFERDQLPKPDNAYDEWLQTVLIKKLEEPAQKRRKEEKLREDEERYRALMAKQAEAALTQKQC